MSDNLTTLAVVGLALAGMLALGLTLLPDLLATLDRVAGILP